MARWFLQYTEAGDESIEQPDTTHRKYLKGQGFELARVEALLVWESLVSPTRFSPIIGRELEPERPSQLGAMRGPYALCEQPDSWPRSQWRPLVQVMPLGRPAWREYRLTVDAPTAVRELRWFGAVEERPRGDGEISVDAIACTVGMAPLAMLFPSTGVAEQHIPTISLPIIQTRLVVTVNAPQFKTEGGDNE